MLNKSCILLSNNLLGRLLLNMFIEYKFCVDIPKISEFNVKNLCNIINKKENEIFKVIILLI